MIIGTITVFECDNCHKKEHYGINDNGSLSRTELTQTTKTNARHTKWVITKDGKWYCPDCAKKLRLRNSGVSKESQKKYTGLRNDEAELLLKQLREYTEKPN